MVTGVTGNPCGGETFHFWKVHPLPPGRDLRCRRSVWCGWRFLWGRNLPFIEGLSSPSWWRHLVWIFGEVRWVLRGSAVSVAEECGGVVEKCGRSCGKVRQELRRGAAVMEKCGRSCGKVRRFLWSVLQCCGVRFSPSRFLHPLLAPRWNHLVTVRYGPMAWSSSSGSMHRWSGRLSGWFPGLWL